MKQTIVFIDKSAPKAEQTYRYFRGDELTESQLAEMGISTKLLSPTFNAGYTFRVRTCGQTYKGHVTTQGDLVVKM